MPDLGAGRPRPNASWSGDSRNLLVAAGDGMWDLPGVDLGARAARGLSEGARRKLV